MDCGPRASRGGVPRFALAYLLIGSAGLASVLVPTQAAALVGDEGDPAPGPAEIEAAGRPYGTYWFDPDGPGPIAPFEGQYDDAAGGGWLMVLNYVHQGGTNPELLVRATDLPLRDSSTLGDDESGTATWGHAAPSLLSAFNITELRFFGAIRGPWMHFSTDEPSAIAYAQTGLGNMLGIKDRFVPLDGHTTQLPAALEQGWTDQGDFALTSAPFWVAISHNWSIRVEGYRWEVDDYAAGTGTGYQNDTVHRVWIRTRVSSAQIDRFRLWDAAGDVVIDEDFRSGERINLRRLGDCVAIEVVGNEYLQTFNGPGSIAFGFDGSPLDCAGEAGRAFENQPPFAWEGEEPGGLRCAASLTELGSHELTVIPYNEDDCAGVPGMARTLAFTVTDAAMCGDGIREEGEECDDGNVSNRDGCLNSCRIAFCGDGFVGPDEECDDGNLSDTDSCTTACVVNDPPPATRRTEEITTGCAVSAPPHATRRMPDASGWFVALALAFGLARRCKRTTKSM